jgi:uncharacterized protein (DUF1697 family)
MKYIALLKGINVGRHKRIKMADLKHAIKSIGFKNIKTYLQSGNVIFEHDSTDSAKVAEDIEEKIDQTFEFSVNVIIRTEDELESIIKVNPFIKEVNIELDKLHVTFLSDIPDPETIMDLDIKKDENEKFEVIGREVYLYCPNGYGNTRLKNDVFEKKLNTTATTRNWKTTNKLLEMSRKIN